MERKSKPVIETFGKVALPEQLKELDKRLMLKFFGELVHFVGCSCIDCEKGADLNARLLTFGRTRATREKAKSLARTEREVVLFRKGMEKDLKYL